MSRTRPLHTGEVFTFWIDPIGEYGAFQVTGFNEAGLYGALLLDWTGPRPATEADVAGMGPLRRTSYRWTGQTSQAWTDGELPERYILAGRTDPLASARKSTEWSVRPPDGVPHVVERRWAALPEDVRARFADAVHSRDHVVERDLPRDPARSTVSALAGEARALRLVWGAWTDELAGFLRGHPIGHAVTLSGPQPAVVDLRGTGVVTLAILDPAGVREVRLDEATTDLSFAGPPTDRVDVDAPREGRGVTLHLATPSVIPRGVAGLDGLWIRRTADVSARDIVRAYPNLRELGLVGEPGTVADFGALGALGGLRLLHVTDLFGYSARDLPAPAAWPDLETLWLQSIPADVAVSAKRAWKGACGLTLTVMQPRTAAWVAANRDNPFRAWDGDAAIPAKAASTAAATYRKFHTALVAVAGRAERDHVQAAAEQHLRDYLAVFNKLDDRHAFLDTLLREQVMEAWERIAAAAEEALGEPLDRDAFRSIEEHGRDF